MSAPQIYALLVGVDRYANPQEAPHLRGCVADAEGVHAFLTGRLGVSEKNIHLLTARMEGGESPERLATRANIIKGWQEHLGQAGGGDQVFFHYSGHGAQARSVNPNEPDGYDETVVPHDSRTPGIYDILDKELAALIDAAEARGAAVTVVLDCCHSGSGTRAAANPDETKPLVRRCSRDNRERPPDTVISGTRIPQASTRALRPPSGWELAGGHVLLAGCRDEELSHEYRSPETNQWHGATTYFLLKALASRSVDTTWGDLHDSVQTHVHATYPQQSPQLEGPANRQVFGGLSASITPYLLVTEVEGDRAVKVSGGAAVGLTPGSRVAIYPPASDMAGQPLVEGAVEETKIDHAWVALDSAAAVEPASRIRITALGYSEQTHRVGVDDPAVQAALKTVANGEPSPFIEVVPTDEPGALFRVVVQNGRYAVQDSTGAQIVTETQPCTPEGAARIASQLEHLAVYRNVQLLRNPTPYSALEGAISIEAVTYTRLSRSNRPYDPMPLRESGNEAVLSPGHKLHLTVCNNTYEPLYVAVFNLSANYGIARIHPDRRPYELVAGQGEIVISGIEPEVANPNLARSLEIVKVFATADPVSFDVLQLPELNEGDARQRSTRAAGTSPLDQLLNSVRHDGSKTRKLVVRRDDTHNRWITEQLEIAVLAAGRRQPLPAGATSVEVGTLASVTLDKPAAFSGELILSSVAQTSLGRDISTGVQPPPGLQSPDAAEIFQPVTLDGGTRSVGTSPAVLAIEAEASQLASITPENPLRLELDVADEPDLQGILPVAYDGEFYYLVGQQAEARTRSVAGPGQRRLAVEIDRLPLPVEGEEEAGSRDLKRTVRLFLYKVFHRELPADTGVRRATLSPRGDPVYAPVTQEDVEKAERVALLVHGFTSSTEWFVRQAWPHLQSLGNYDLCLTYDYESFGTSMAQNGRLLSQELQGLGFGENDNVQLDVFCHSMGTQVARALVEMADGHRFVDRVFMGGAPNAGTPLARGKDLIMWAGTVLLNQAGLAPPTLLASWFLKKLGDAAVSVDELAPDSQFYRDLNDNPARLDVPYYVQIGANTAADAPLDWRRLFSKSGLLHVADDVLDVVLGGQNDLLVGVASARAVRHGNWPRLTVTELPGHHFQYFYTRESLDSLQEWMG